MDFDPGFSIAGPVRIRQDLDHVLLQGDGVVIGDGARVLEAKHGVGIEPLRPGAVGALGLRRRAGEASIVAREEAREEGVRGGLIADAGETELGDEAILQRAKEALDAPRPFAWGLEAGTQVMPSSCSMRPTWVGARCPCSCSASVQRAFPVRLKIPGRSE